MGTDSIQQYKVAYKIVCRWRNSRELFSTSIFWGTDTVYRKQYRIGEYTNEVHGSFGIFCFDTLKRASSFGKYHFCPDSEIQYFVYEVNGVVEKKLPREICSIMTIENLLRFYATRFSPNSLVHTQQPPDGTVCFEKVLVVKDVTDKYLTLF